MTWVTVDVGAGDGKRQARRQDELIDHGEGVGRQITFHHPSMEGHFPGLKGGCVIC